MPPKLFMKDTSEDIKPGNNSRALGHKALKNFESAVLCTQNALKIHLICSICFVLVNLYYAFL